MRLFVEDISVWDPKTEADCFNPFATGVISLTFQFDDVRGLMLGGKVLSKNVFALDKLRHVKGRKIMAIVGKCGVGKSPFARSIVHAFGDVERTRRGSKIPNIRNKEFLSGTSSNLGRIVWGDVMAEQTYEHSNLKHPAKRASVRLRKALKGLELREAAGQDGLLIWEHGNLCERQYGYSGFDSVAFINEGYDQKGKKLTLVVGKNAPLRPQIENLKVELGTYLDENAINALPPPQRLM